MYRRQKDQPKRKTDGRNKGNQIRNAENNLISIGNEGVNQIINKPKKNGPQKKARKKLTPEQKKILFQRYLKMKLQEKRLNAQKMKKEDLTGYLIKKVKPLSKYNADPRSKLSRDKDVFEIDKDRKLKSLKEKAERKVWLDNIKKPKKRNWRENELLQLDEEYPEIQEVDDDFPEDFDENQINNEEEKKNEIVGQQSLYDSLAKRLRNHPAQRQALNLANNNFFDNEEQKENNIESKDNDYSENQAEKDEIINKNRNNIKIGSKINGKKSNKIIKEEPSTGKKKFLGFMAKHLQKAKQELMNNNDFEDPELEENNIESEDNDYSESQTEKDIITVENWGNIKIGSKNNGKNSNKIKKQQPDKKYTTREDVMAELNKHPYQKQAIDFLNSFINPGQSKENEEKIKKNVEPLIKEEKLEDSKEPLIKEEKQEDAKESEIKNNIIEEVKDSLNKKERLEDGGEPLIGQNAPGEDLEQIDKSLEPVRGLDFVVQTLPERKKRGLGTKILNWLSYYSGKTIGKIGGFFAALGKGIFDLFRKGKPGVFGGIRNSFRGSERFHSKENPGAIPGWDGAAFQEMEGPDDQVKVDFRRVPDVWSVMTAEKAAEGDEKDKTAKPRAPVISVYVNQTSDEYTAASDGSGHTGIGIEYSRYSAKAGRWQRYNVRFGYGMASMGASFVAKMGVSSYNNAIIPGRLMNEGKKPYNISRSYPAKPKQVNNVLRAAESYADRGGYNVYSRNCTTFAKEMLVDVAKIKGAEDVFTEEDVTMNPKMGLYMFGAGAGAPILKAEMENGFEHVRNKEDQSYENFGNYMVSRGEYEQYKNSLKLFSKPGTRSYSPNAAAENMKRAEGGRSGQIGTYKVIDVDNDDANNSPLFQILQPMGWQLEEMKDNMKGIIPENKKPDELKNLISELSWPKFLSKVATALPGYMNPQTMKAMKQSNLINGRSVMTDMIKKLNMLLFKYYKNDRRIHDSVLNVINTLNNAATAIDDVYRASDENLLVSKDEDLGDLKSQFTKKHKLYHNGKELSLSPTQYEAWLQIFKDPQIVFDKLQKILELQEKKKTGLTAEQTKEFNTLLRINGLACDFINAHNYMIDKENFNQQDIDYALSLEKKERAGGLKSEMLEQQDENDPTMADMKNPNASASGIYLMMIMKTVFGGMKERFKRQFQKNNDLNEGINWLSGDASDCIKNHEQEMTNIIRGLKHTTENPKKKDLQKGFSQLLTRWLFQVFHEGTDKDIYQRIVGSIVSEESEAMQETDKIITKVLDED